MTSIRHFLRSPLGRHPNLLGRKVAERFGLRHNPRAVLVPAGLELDYPAHWVPELRRWLRQVPLAPVPHRFARVFGQDFEEQELLRMCREGPKPGEPGLKADIKLAWDFSRAQAVFTNAAADPETLEVCADFLKRWLAANRDLGGPTWSCAMELAIRAINWIFADALFARKLGERLGAQWAVWLWRHGAMIWQGLEARLYSSNHYLADLLGLLVIGSVFPGDAQARKWLRFARTEFPRALLAQTRADGGLAEASLRYHAFVTEMGLLFRLAQGQLFPSPAEARLRQMCQVVADFRDATGDVFAIGDDDSGRVLALDFASALGRAEILLQLAACVLPDGNFAPSSTAAYSQSGWWVRRAGDFVIALDFGGVGLGGRGPHAHNDDSSFCLDWRGCSVIVDPGTYLYTGDPPARNRFRSTPSHSTLIVDGREQRELTSDLFTLPGPDEPFAFEPGHPGHGQIARFTRTVGAGLWHTREVTGDEQALTVYDRVAGGGQHHLEWRFHLHSSVRPRVTNQGFVLQVPHAGELLVENSAQLAALRLAPSEYSPGYGRRSSALVCVAETSTALSYGVSWRIRPASAGATSRNPS